MLRKLWRLDYVWSSAILGVAVYDAAHGWWSEAVVLCGIAALAFAAFFWLRRSATKVDLVTPPTFEQGELAVLNKGYEPVETPYDPVGDIIASHDSSCEICTEWKRLRGQSD